MWDSNALLQLLKSMPRKLSKENLEKIQLVIDADKYKNSLISGFDLCEMYAPFCRDCKKTSIYPCALAYANMMKAKGMDIEIDAKPVNELESKKFIEQSSIAEPIIEPQTVISNEIIEETAATDVCESIAEQSTDAEVAEPAEINSEEVQATEAEIQISEPVEEVQPEAESLPAPVQQPAKRRIRIAVARRKL